MKEPINDEEREAQAEMLKAASVLEDITKRMGEASRAGDSARALVLWGEGLKQGMLAVRAAARARAARDKGAA